jgi:pimeloyl-ACP methyl ester carboxylesterase
MAFAKINGVNLNFELHGDSGEPLVLVHGYTGDITDWRHQVPAFSQSHRVLIIDNRGHALDARTGRYAIRQTADDVGGCARDGSTVSTCWGIPWGGAVAGDALNHRTCSR